jgi:hypothetical protein
MSDNTMFFLSLIAVWIGINILFLAWTALGAEIVPRWDDDAPQGAAMNAPSPENPDRRDRGRFTAPILKFDPSNRTALTRKHLTALTKAGDRSA